VQRAHPFYNQKGVCPRWSEYQPRLEGLSATQDSSIALHGIITIFVVFYALCSVLHFAHFLFLLLPPNEVVQRAHTLYNPKGTHPRWSDYQPRLEGQSATQDSSIALEEKDVQCLLLSTLFFLFLVFKFSPLHEVIFVLLVL
jgi:hypothetical protein